MGPKNSITTSYSIYSFGIKAGVKRGAIMHRKGARIEKRLFFVLWTEMGLSPLLYVPRLSHACSISPKSMETSVID